MQTDMFLNESDSSLITSHPLKPASLQALRKRFVMVAAGIALATGCAASALIPIEVELERNFQLQVGQSAHVAEANLTVGFQGVTSDSRCARGESCVWEGDATISIWLQQTGGAKDEFELHTSSRGLNVAVYKGFSVRLVAVHPTPVSGVEIASADYIVTLQVTPGTISGDYNL